MSGNALSPEGPALNASPRSDAARPATGADLESESTDLLTTTASTAFGFSELRAGRLEGMQSVLHGRDTLAVLPTGGGKSAIYQITALLIDGPTVVVSPLIALQRDQVAALTERLGGGAGSQAVAANSAVGSKASAAAFVTIRSDPTEFLFLAPEQLAK